MLLNFWYPLCEACRRESVYLQNAMHIFGPGRVVVLSVNVHPSEDRLANSYIRGNGYFFRPLHMDNAANAVQGQAIPSTLIIDQAGRLVRSTGEIRGIAGERALELQVQALLAEPGRAAELRSSCQRPGNPWKNSITSFPRLWRN